MDNSKVIVYDPEADILAIRIREGKAVDSEWLDNDIILLFGENGELVEVEVHRARRRGLLDVLKALAEYLGIMIPATPARVEASSSLSKA